MSRGRTEARIALTWPVVMSFFARPGLGQQPMQPVDALHPGTGELLAPVGQHPQRLEVGVVGQHPQARSAGRDHGHRVRIVGVGLAVVSGVEQPRPGRELGRHVHHVLAMSQQSLRQRAAGAVAALDRPDPIRPPRHGSTHRRIPGPVGAEPAGGQHRLLTVDDLDRRRQLVGIDPDEHSRHAAHSSSRTIGSRGGHCC
jgi:hypothetical protein